MDNYLCHMEVSTTYCHQILFKPWSWWLCLLSGLSKDQIWGGMGQIHTIRGPIQWLRALRYSWRLQLGTSEVSLKIYFIHHLLTTKFDFDIFWFVIVSRLFKMFNLFFDLLNTIYMLRFLLVRVVLILTREFLYLFSYLLLWIVPLILEY